LGNKDIFSIINILKNTGILCFEFDPAKSLSNKKKHGIDFVAAQSLWDDANARFAEARFVDEQRFTVTGMIGEKYFTGAFTIRESAIRIISVRRARRNEIEAYISRRV